VSEVEVIKINGAEESENRRQRLGGTLEQVVGKQIKSGMRTAIERMLRGEGEPRGRGEGGVPSGACRRTRGC
jgi:hypothetical protein